MEPDAEGKPDKRKASAAGLVAVILAAGLAIALNIITIAILAAAWARLGIDPDSGISENATQLLTGTFGAIIGALSAYLGYTVGKKANGKNGDTGGGEIPRETGSD
jgi:hypothetical protein